MSNKTKNPYATVRGGRIEAPHPDTQQISAVRTVTDGDLRCGK